MRKLAASLRRPVGLTVALQIGWWAAVGGAAVGAELLGPVSIGVLLLIQTRGLTEGESRALFVTSGVLALVGTGLDSLQAATGLVTFSGSPVFWLAPLWITALWAHLSTALDAVARLCGRRWWALALAGAIGGPLSYWGGARVGAATLHPDLWPSVVSLAVQWAVVLPLANRLHESMRTPGLLAATPRPI